METLNITRKIIQLTGTRKKTFRLILSDRPLSVNSYWDGGSRDEYGVFNINTGQSFIPPTGTYPFTTPNQYTLKPGEILVQTGTFCSKPATPTIYCLPEDTTKVRQFLGLN